MRTGADGRPIYIKRGVNTYVHTCTHTEKTEVEEDGGLPRSLRLPFASAYVVCCCCTFCKVDRWMGRVNTIFLQSRQRRTHLRIQTKREREREENTPFTRTFSFGLGGTKPLLVMMMMMILDPLFFSSLLPSFLVHPISHRIPSHLSILSRKKVPANWFSLPAYRKFRGCFLIHDREGDKGGTGQGHNNTQGFDF